MKIFFIVSLLILTSCATGRVALIDIDLRNEEQIKAYRKEASVPYENAKGIKEEMVTPKIIDVKSWNIIIKIVEVFKGRIRIGSIEWDNNDRENKK